jgi:hypothetical protein
MSTRAAQPSTGGVLARLERHPGPTFAAIGACFAVLYVAAIVLRPDRQRIVDGDAIQYYAYLRSLVFDRDLDFANDYERLYGASPESSGWLREQTPAGRPRNMMSIGPAILWAPIYLPVVGAGAVASAVGLPVTVDGFAPPYPLAAGVAGILYATLGAYFCFRTVALRFSRRASFWGAVVAWLAGSALYYSLVSPAYAHAASIFTSAIVVFAWLRSIGDERPRRWILIGALTGLAMLVRWHSVILLALPGLELLSGIRRRPPAQTLTGLALAGIAAAVVFLPQLLAWKAIYGQYVVVPQGAGFMRWMQPEIVAVLFSTRRGLFLWTPALILAAAGLVLLVRRDRLLGAGSIVVLLLTLYVNSAARDWWAGEAFGARRFVGETVFFALGFAALGSALASRVSLAWLRAGAVALIFYNGLFLVQYQLFMRGYRDLAPYPTTVRQILVDRLLLPITLVRHWLDD